MYYIICNHWNFIITQNYVTYVIVDFLEVRDLNSSALSPPAKVQRYFENARRAGVLRDGVKWAFFKRKSNDLEMSFFLN